MTPQPCTPEAMLERLVAFDSVVGRPNGALMAFALDWLQGAGAACRLLPGPEGDRANLFASFGDVSRPGWILSGHVDVVPATEPGWLGDPFVLRRDGDRLIGRGACDMKGFVAAMLAMAPWLGRLTLSAPVHLALTYDEEAGCRGAPHLIAALPGLCAAPAGAIVGEPTGLRPVLAHKGKAALRVAAKGRAGHSARPDLGVNAIHALTPVLAAAVAQARALERSTRDERFAPPWSSLQVGLVAGGRALNIIPEAAEAHVEARAIAGVDPAALLAPVVAAAQAAGAEVEQLSSYPALALPADHPLAALAERISGRAALGAVSFGTEAGLYQQAGVPAVICGPGDIDRAHRPEEYLTRDELRAACAMIGALGRALSA
jgi:acetylornithine deacetylase